MNKYLFFCNFRYLSNFIKLKNTNKTAGAVSFAAQRCTCCYNQPNHARRTTLLTTLLPPHRDAILFPERQISRLLIGSPLVDVAHVTSGVEPDAVTLRGLGDAMLLAHLSQHGRHIKTT